MKYAKRTQFPPSKLHLSHPCPDHAFLVTIDPSMRFLVPILLATLATTLVVGCKRATPAPTTRAASQPTTIPATEPAELTYVDIIRASYPKMPATQPLGVPVERVNAKGWVHGSLLLPLVQWAL